MAYHPELQWSKIHEYLTEVASARDVNGLLRLALDRMGGLIPFDHNGLIGFHDFQKRIAFQETLTVMGKTNDEFQNYYYKVMPDLGWNSIEFSCVNWDDYLDTEYVTDFILPNHIQSSGGIILTKSNCGQLTISVNRSRDLPCFNEAEQSTFEVIQQHLANYLAMLSVNSWDSAPDVGDIASSFSVLTRRESEIASLVCRKYSAEIIGSRLLISPRTVNKHLENIYAKMKVNCRKELRIKLLGCDEFNEQL